MPNDLVSIIMPSYNSADFISESIESVIAQTYPYWELLITDDCSTDNTVEVVKQYTEKDDRIKLFVLPENSGAAVARNKSIKEAQGRYIALLDSDDLWKKEKLERQVRFMEENNYEFTYASCLVYDETKNDYDLEICRRKETYTTIKRGDRIPCLTTMYDTKNIGKIYMPVIRKRQDWGYRIKIFEKCKVAYGIKEPLAIYRVRANSLSKNKLGLIKYNIGIYRQVLHFSAIKSYLYFFLVFAPVHMKKKLLLRIYNY